MRYWWVNQNQTSAQEIDGGYIWSPKRNKPSARQSTGSRNPYYENMREVAPGDVIFSFCDTLIVAVGTAQTYCYECPKPEEFGAAGPNWSAIGWKVDVAFRRLDRRIRPKDHIALLRPHLADRYAPLQDNGNGLQGVYLAEINQPFADVLGGLIGTEAQLLMAQSTNRPLDMSENIVRRGVEEWEDHIQQTITDDRTISGTDKMSLVKARRGQGLYKQRLLRIEHCCRITRVDNPIHLIGSHIKPWRDSNNAERLDGENGLLLTPTIDHLFDRGFISFEDNGDLIPSPRADRISLARMGIQTNERINVGTFSQRQRAFLDFHRNSILLQARH